MSDVKCHKLSGFYTTDNCIIFSWLGSTRLRYFSASAQQKFGSTRLNYFTAQLLRLRHRLTGVNMVNVIDSTNDNEVFNTVSGVFIVTWTAV